MDSISDDTAMQDVPAPARSGAMRVVMLNARTAVLVPDEDPVSGPDGEQGDPTLADGDPDAPAVADADADADSSASPWTGDDSPVAAVDTDEEGTAPASDDDPSPADDAYAPAVDTASGDALLPSGDQAATDVSPSATGPVDKDRWKAELLARLDDLARLLSRAQTPATPVADAGQPAFAAALERLERRLDAGLEGIESRVARLEQAEPAPAASPDPDLSEAVADLRMQVRMIEVQVGTLGKLLVSGPPADGLSADALRTRLAEVMASEQRLAATP